MTAFDLTGVFAGVFVLLAFFVIDQRRLRQYALLSNVLFLIYAAGLGLWPVFLLHGLLLPLNVLRLDQIGGDLTPVPPGLCGRRREHLDREFRFTAGGVRAPAWQD